MHAAAAMEKVVSIPVIGVGRINCPLEAAGYLNDGKADLVAVGRQFIADAVECHRLAIMFCPRPEHDDCL